MTNLYNLRTIPSGWQVTKFDDDFNVESSYEMTQDDELRCGCPAGARPTCRHRQMFSQLSDRVDTAWFLDFDTRAWVDPTGEAASSESETEPTPTEALSKLVGFDITDDNARPVPPKRTVLEESSPQPEPILSLPDSHPFRRRM